MSLSTKNLASVQKAGQAVHTASQAIADVVRSQAADVAANLASQPFGSATEQIIARFKSLSNLSQGLALVELELQKLFSIATELASPAADVIVLPPVRKGKALNNSAVVDVSAKSVKVVKKQGKKSAPRKELTPNDKKLLNFLLSALGNHVGKTTAITGVAMARGAGLPSGSVGVSLKKILTAGLIKTVGRGQYQLGGTSIAPVVDTTSKLITKQRRTKSANTVNTEKTGPRTSKSKLPRTPKPKAQIPSASSPDTAPATV